MDLTTQIERIQRIPQPILLVDPETLLIVAANEACGLHISIPGKRLLGRSLLQWVPDAEKEDLKLALRAATRRGEKSSIELRWEYSEFESGTMEKLCFVVSLVLEGGRPSYFQLASLPQMKLSAKKPA